MIDIDALPSQLTKWTVRVSACALPSFILSLTIGINTPAAIAAMVSGIATFIIAFALFTSTRFYLDRRQGLIGRSLRAGTRARMIISLGSLPVLAAALLKWESLIPWIPDFWCGYLAVLIVEEFDNIFALGIVRTSFITVYTITVIEGILISVTLGFLCLLALWPISMRPISQSPPDPTK